MVKLSPCRPKRATSATSPTAPRWPTATPPGRRTENASPGSRMKAESMRCTSASRTAWATSPGSTWASPRRTFIRLSGRPTARRSLTPTSASTSGMSTWRRARLRRWIPICTTAHFARSIRCGHPTASGWLIPNNSRAICTHCIFTNWRQPRRLRLPTDSAMPASAVGTKAESTFT